MLKFFRRLLNKTNNNTLSLEEELAELFSVINVDIELVNDGKMPEKATDNSACYDVFAREIEKVADDTYYVKLGFKATPDKEFKIVLVPRSSITKTDWILQNSPGQGDPDFYLEYQARFKAFPNGYDKKANKLTYSEFPYNVGDRVAQMYISYIHNLHFSQVKNVNKSTNRSGGFGSTGK